MNKLPYNSYLKAWRAFRDVSKEEHIIAPWLISQSAWPCKPDYRLTDLGCGDGMVTGAIIDYMAKRSRYPASITLLDPNKKWLKAAADHVQDILRKNHIANTPKTSAYKAQDAPEILFNADAVLFVHVVYLMDTSDFKTLLTRIKPGIPLYVVLDHPESVFYELWKDTAPIYHKRVEQAHKIIQSLPSNKFEVTKSKSGELISGFPQKKLKEEFYGSLLISQLCYNDKLDIDKDENFKKLFWETVSRHCKNGEVKCRSVGYQIIRKPA